MIQRHHQAAVLLEELTVLLADLKVRADDLHGADAAQTHDDLGLHQCPLPLEVALAGVLLRVHGIPVLRRAALNGVGDIQAAAVQPDHLQHIVQQLAAPTHEGLALLVLVSAGGFADDHDLRILPAHAEDHVGARFRQCTGVTAQTFLPQGFPLGHSRFSFISL